MEHNFSVSLIKPVKYDKEWQLIRKIIINERGGNQYFKIEWFSLIEDKKV